MKKDKREKKTKCYKSTAYYLKESSKEARSTLMGNIGNFIKYLLWEISLLFGKSLFLTNHIFSIADINMTKTIANNNKMEIITAFNKVEEKKSFFTFIFTKSIEIIIFFAGFILIGLVGTIFGTIGYVISLGISDHTIATLLPFIFAGPFALILIVYVFGCLLVFAPTNYILSENNDLNVGETLILCTKTMKNGKIPLFLINLYCISILLLYLGIAGVGCYFLISSQTLILNILGYILTVLLVTLFIFLYSYISCKRKIAILFLFEDIVVMDVNIETLPTETREERRKAKKVLKANSKEEMLVQLFNEEKVNTSTDD